MHQPFARALDAGDLARAAIAAVHLGLPPLSDPAAFARLAAADRLLKGGFDSNEPRDERGRWTSGTDAEVLPLSARSSEARGGPAADGTNVMLAQEFLLATPPVAPEDGILPQFKEAIPRISGEEGAKDPPSWARGQRPFVGESGKDFAKRLLDEKYGKGNYKKGPDTEFSKIQKWGDRAFRDPKALPLPSPDVVPPGTVI